MSTTPVKVEDFRHAKMKEIAAKSNKTIQATYADAIDSFLAGRYQEMILADSKLEQLISVRMNKMVDRLAAMISSNNFDTSTILMGLTHLNSKEFGKERNDIYQVYRKEAAAYEQNKRQNKSK